VNWQIVVERRCHFLNRGDNRHLRVRVEYCTPTGRGKNKSGEVRGMFRILRDLVVGASFLGIGIAHAAPPSAPSNLVATAVSGTQINLTWGASTDDVAVIGYRIERCRGATCTSFVQIAIRVGTNFNDSGLARTTAYRYRVRAFDLAGNSSAYSNIASATTLTVDTSAPTTPAGLVATSAGSNQINLAWTASTDNVGVTGYRVERCQGSNCTNFVQIATPTSTSLSNTGLTASTAYRYRVRAADATGNLSAYSKIVSATTSAGDTTAPSAPGGLAASPASSTQINLAWTASTDNVGVSGYRVERCQGVSCVTFAQVATLVATSFSDTALTPSTSYSYRVRAADAAGNLSGYSNISTAVTQTPDTTPPGVTILSPQDQSTLSASALTAISAQYSDSGSGINSATVRLALDGADITALSQVTAAAISYTPAQPYAVGTHSVSLTVGDLAGNVVVATWGFTVAGLPTISGQTPKDVVLPGGAKPEVGAVYAGTGSDIDVTNVSLLLNGQNVTTQAIVTTAGVLYVVPRSLAVATHSVTLTVPDFAGNVASSTWTFAVDDPAPNFYDESPRDVFIVDRNPIIRVLLSGFGIVPSSVRFYLDGADLTAQSDAAIDHIVFVPIAPLANGAHTVNVSATDARGVSASKQWSFTVQTPPPPSVTTDGVRTERTVVPVLSLPQ
jgi:chitodextrinase